jgi:hypothetical protein
VGTARSPPAVVAPSARACIGPIIYVM